MQAWRCVRVARRRVLRTHAVRLSPDRFRIIKGYDVSCKHDVIPFYYSTPTVARYSILFRSHVQQVFPAFIHFCLELLDQVLISRLEEMLEAALGTEEILDGKLLLRLVVEDPFSLDHLEEGPVASIDRQFADLGDVGECPVRWLSSCLYSCWVLL